MRLTDATPAGLTLKDLFGDETPPKWGESLVRHLNLLQRALQEPLQAKLGRDNLGWDYKEALFSHGVAVTLSCTRVTAPKGVIVLGADGQIVDAVEPHPSSVPGQMLVTLYFRDPSAANVRVGFYILPDGCASGKTVP